MSDLEKIKQLRQSTGAGFKDCSAALKESGGDSFLGDDINDFGIKTDFLDEKDYSKEYKEKSKLIVNSVDEIYKETIQKYENSNNPLSDKEKKLIRSYLDNIRLVLILLFADSLMRFT